MANVADGTELRKFEIYADHDSLQYLFSQKSPSQRILRLCEFLADFDFDEIKYYQDHTLLFPTFSLTRGMALRLTCLRQSIHWRLVQHVASRKHRDLCPYLP